MSLLLLVFLNILKSLKYSLQERYDNVQYNFIPIKSIFFFISGKLNNFNNIINFTLFTTYTRNMLWGITLQIKNYMKHYSKRFKSKRGRTQYIILKYSSDNFFTNLNSLEMGLMYLSLE